MNRRAILGYWLLLFVPTVVVGLVAFRVIRHEGDRIAAQARAAALDRARALADHVRLAVAAVQDDLGESLRRLPPESLEDALAALAAGNPLVRNVFVWDPAAGLRMPSPESGWTAEERRFAARYEALFSGRLPWAAAAAAPASEAEAGRTPAAPAAADAGASSEFLRQAEAWRSGGRGLAAATPARLSEAQAAPAAAAPRWTGGWIPWFTENRLHVLGWVRRDARAPVYGMELELAALLSRLMPAFPSATPDGAAYALLDDTEQVVCQAGGREPGAGVRPDLAVSLAPYLPHWAVGVFFPAGARRQAAGRSFVVVAGLLLAIVLVAILAGGTLLTWQAHQHLADARRKTSFVSNISHELKTPLTSIRLYAELLSEGRVAGADKTRGYLRTIVAESQRLTRLVNNVLDFSRLEQGKKTYRRECLDGADVLRRFGEDHRLRLADAGLVLSLDLPAAPVWLRADRDALEQVLLNLVDNAIKYAAAGGALHIALEQRPDRCRLVVMDRGPGIAPPHCTRIFDMFYRVDNSLTTRQPGSGLGLSIARRLLRDLGGDLTYEPRAGGGSCFVVSLPRGAAPDAPAPDAPAGS